MAVIGNVFASGGGNSIKVSKNIEFHQGQNKVFHLIYGDKTTSVVEVRFLDARGKELAQYSIGNETGFRKKFNLSKLKAGNYTLQVNSDGERISKKFIIPEDVAINAVKRGDQFRIFTENNTNEDFKLNIYNDDMKLVHTETQSESFARSYDLSKVVSNNFIFEVVSNGTSKNILLNN